MQRRLASLTHETTVNITDKESSNIWSNGILRARATDKALNHEIDGHPRLCIAESTSAIGEHLCGRDQEIIRLADAYLRSVGQKHQELVLIHGNAGTGKTALAETLRLRMRSDGFFLSGKFELGKCQEPYAVFVSAFTQLVNELIGSAGEGDDRLKIIRHVVRHDMGDDAQVLTNMIPALEQLIGSSCGEKVESSGKDALRQFQYLFCKFCRSITTVVPLVLFMDDLQWADRASFELLQALIHCSSSQAPASLLIVGAYRDQEVQSRHPEELQVPFASSLPQDPPFYFCLRDLINQSSSQSSLVNITTIHLCNLNEDATNELVARSLKLSPDATVRLSQIVHAESKGNPFHSAQYLLRLSEQGLMFHDAVTGKWEWDDKLTACDQPQHASVDDMVCQKMRNLSTTTRKVLEIAALLGDEVDEPALAVVLEEATLPDISRALQSAAEEGLVVHTPNRGRYRFAHDNIRQAALSTIQDKEIVSFNIGYALWQRLPPLYLDSKIFTVVSLMRDGVHVVTDSSQRYKLASLHLEAGLKAYSRVAFHDASRYLDAGIEFLQGGDYWSDEYQLTLDLFNAAVDSALCNQRFDRLSLLVKEIQEHGRNLRDKLPAFVAQINAMGQHECVHDATRVGMDVLTQLGESLPRGTSTFVLATEIIKTKLALRKRTKESIFTLPSSQNEDKIAAMNIMSILLPYAFQASSKQVVVIGARLSRLCLKHGLKTGYALGLATFAFILCRSQKDEGYRVGRLALDVVDHPQTRNTRHIMPRIYMYFYGLVHHWKRPLAESLAPLARGVQVGEEIGDIEYAMINLRFQCLHAYHAGKPLSLVEQMTVDAVERMRLFKQDVFLQLTTPLIQLLQKLQRDHLGSDDWQLPSLDDDPTLATIRIMYVRCNMEMDLSHLLGNYDGFEAVAEHKRKLNAEGITLYSFAIVRWKESLTAVAQARRGIRKRHNPPILIRCTRPEEARR